MLATFPPCKIQVKVPAILWTLAKLYLEQVSYVQLELEVFHLGFGGPPIDLRSITKVIDLKLYGVVVNVDEIPVSVERLSLRNCHLVSYQPNVLNLNYLTNLTHLEILD